MPVRSVRPVTPGVQSLLDRVIALRGRGIDAKNQTNQQFIALLQQLQGNVLQFIDKKKADRRRKSDASKERKEGRLKAGIGLVAGAAGGALVGPALLGGLGATAAAGTVVGGGLAAGGTAGLSAGSAALLGGTLGGLGGLSAGFGVPNAVPTVAQLGAFNLEQQKLGQGDPFIPGSAFGFNRSSTDNIGSPAPIASPAISPALPIGQPIGVPGGPFPAQGGIPLPNLKTQGPGAKSPPPRAAVDPVTAGAHRLRQLGEERFAAGDMEGAQQLAKLLAELEVA